MLNVLHVVASVAWRYGGVTATVLPMCDALAKQPGVRVEIACTDADGPGGRLTAATLPNCSVKVNLLQRNISERWKVSWGLARWLNRSVGQFDAVHVHGVWSFATTAASRAARRRGVPTVILPQGMLSRYSWGRSSMIKHLYWQTLERANVRAAARLHLTSQGEAREMAHLRLENPVSFIPLGLEAEAFTAPVRTDWLRDRLEGRDRGRPIVLFLSRIHPKKGIVDLLLPALARLDREAFLVIAGDDDPHRAGYRETVRRAIDQLGLNDRVCLLGPVSRADRWAAFDGADAFVLPSHQENFGLVMTEAMARGKPVVVTETASACEHVSAAAAGHVVPANSEAIAEGLGALLADPASARATGERGRDYARQTLTWERLAPRIVEMYRQTVARS